MDAEPSECSSLAKIAKLRVAIISDAAPGRNGVGTYYVDLLTQIEPYVQDIQMLCPTLEGEKWNASLVLPLPGDRTQKLCMPNPFSLRRQLAALNPHIVFIATPGAYGLLGAFLADRMGIPAVAGFHTSFEQITKLYWNDSALGRVVHQYFKMSNSYLFKKCALVLANTDTMVRQAKALGAPETALVSTDISPVFSGHPLAPYSGDCKRIFFAGRLAPEKNIDAIFEAAQAFPNLQFTLAGDGPERAQVQRWRDQLPNLKYLGWLTREALRDQIDQHDMLVLPSHFESFGTIALEAMARGRLVTVSSSCGIAQWPTLRAGLYLLGRHNLTTLLNQVVAQSPQERIAKAQKALELTHVHNQRSLHKWFALLHHVVEPASGGSKSSSRPASI